MKTFVAGLLVLYLSFCAGLALAQNPEKEQAAIVAAQQWLELVDANHYGRSWQQAATHFQTGVSKTKWRDAMMAVRKPLGRLQSRQLLSADYQTSLPGAPDGEYVVIQFQTSFANKQKAVETVTPKLETDGSWRVSGYYIR